MSNYFAGIDNLEDLKKAFHKLAMEHHPDLGGDLETMKAINDEFDRLFPLLKHKHKNKDGEAYTSDRNAAETPEEWREIIEALFALHMEGTTIEVIGSFLWISGNTKPYKDQIKGLNLGFRFSPNKQAWYLAPEDYHKRSRKKYDLQEIRKMYGSQTVTADEDKKQTKRKPRKLKSSAAS